MLSIHSQWYHGNQHLFYCLVFENHTNILFWSYHCIDCKCHHKFILRDNFRSNTLVLNQIIYTLSLFCSRFHQLQALNIPQYFCLFVSKILFSSFILIYICTYLYLWISLVQYCLVQNIYSTDFLSESHFFKSFYLSFLLFL